MDSDFSIHIRSICNVVPASPTQRCMLPLTSLDFLNRNVTCMQRILFYSLERDSDQESFVSRLKSSLGETLVRFFPLAGRFTDGELEKPRINCNEAGVPFIEAAMQRKSLSEFLLSPHCMELCSELAHVETSELADAPHIAPLSVQVTRFRSGGLAVGVAYNHFLIDGYSFWHFMKSWSEVSCGESISLQPVHSREIHRPALKTANFNAAVVMHLSSLPRYFAVPATASMEVPVGFSNIQQRVYNFPSHFITRLKLEYGLQSRFRAVCAYIWRALVRARGLHGSDQTRFFLGVDVRKRLVPSLPDGYFGNAVCAVYAETTAGELTSERGIAHAASLLTEAIAGATDGSIRGLLDWCDMQGNAYFRGADYAHDNNYVVLSSPRFPAYEIDYGFGAPAAVRPGKLPWSGVITFFGESDGGMDVCICLAPHEFKTLEQQEVSFLQGEEHVTPVCGFKDLVPPNILLMG